MLVSCARSHRSIIIEQGYPKQYPSLFKVSGLPELQPFGSTSPYPSKKRFAVPRVWFASLQNPINLNPKPEKQFSPRASSAASNTRAIRSASNGYRALMKPLNPHEAFKNPIKPLEPSTKNGPSKNPAESQARSAWPRRPMRQRQRHPRRQQCSIRSAGSSETYLGFRSV